MSRRRRCTRWRASSSRNWRCCSPAREAGKSSNLASTSDTRLPKRSLLARVWGSGHEYEVSIGVGSEVADELKALVASAGAFGRIRTSVRLINDHKFGTGSNEVVTSPVGLDEVDRDDGVVVDVEDRQVVGQSAFEATGRGAQHELGVDVEFVLQFRLPLLSQVRWAQDAQSVGRSLLQQFLGDERRLDGLADADVVGNQQPHRVELESHQQRHKLVGPGRYRDLGD